MITAYLLTAIMALTGIIGFSTTLKCTDITDIYARPDIIDYVHDKKCPYTLTVVCNECPSYFVRRSDYDDWAEGFTRYGSVVPHPKRTDTNNIIYPK